MLIKYIKSVLWRVAKCLSYIEEARCLKVKLERIFIPLSVVNCVVLAGYVSPHVATAIEYGSRRANLSDPIQNKMANSVH